MEPMKVSKVRRKKSAVRKLTGALKDLLEEKKLHRGNDTVVEKTEMEQSAQAQDGREDGIKYIYSRENQIIPKLTDEEVLERHKRADLNMKHVWDQIIKKYENIQDQGDVVDLQTGEIIEDNGHLRSMTLKPSEKAIGLQGQDVRYHSVLKDIIEIKDFDGSVWDDQEQDEDEQCDVSDYEEEEKASLE